MEEIEYKDNAKVLFKIRAKLRLENREAEEVECFVTDSHVIIEAEERIKIPLLYVKYCRTENVASYEITSEKTGDLCG